MSGEDPRPSHHAPQHPGEPELERALDVASDADRMFEGEDPGTAELEDAEHWLHVYAELASFKQDLILRTERARETVAAPGGTELDNDLVVLRAERDRLERRHEFWSNREQQLREQRESRSG